MRLVFWSTIGGAIGDPSGSSLRRAGNGELAGAYAYFFFQPSYSCSSQKHTCASAGSFLFGAFVAVEMLARCLQQQY
jgi:hypothetical protein